MNFDDILNQWEDMTAKPVGKKKIKEAALQKEEDEKRIELEKKKAAIEKKRISSGKEGMIAYLNQYGTYDKDKDLDEQFEKDKQRIVEKEYLIASSCDARIDLHGLIESEAESRLIAFLEGSRQRGFKKVLIIHGKGHHSKGEPVLGKMVKRVLDSTRFAGARKEAAKQDGGSGAIVVILREKEKR